MALEIQHDPSAQKFFTLIDGHESSLKYRKINEKELEYYHTYVPEVLRGQGIAAEIVQYALDYAKAHQIKVIPTCPYVKAYLQKHPI